MRLFNSGESASYGGADDRWRVLGELNSSEQNEYQQEEEQKSRRQRKIVEFFKLKNMNDAYPARALEAKNIELEAGDEERILQYMATDNYTANDKREMIGLLTPNVAEESSEYAVFQNNFSENSYKKALLSGMIPTLFTPNEVTWRDVEPRTIRALIEKYPTPVDIEDSVSNYLNFLNDTYPGYDEFYAKEMHDAMKAIYGSRQDYYDAINDLESKVHANEKAPAFEFYSLNSYDSEEVLRASKNEGDDYFGDSARHLSWEDLKGADLAPKYLAILKDSGEEIRVALSKQFRVGGNREAAIAYIKDRDGKVMQHGYYRSASQGTWRLLADYAKDGDNLDHFWFGKGMGEQMMILPSGLQGALAELSKYEEANIGGTDSYYLLGGAAKYYDSQKEYRTAKDGAGLRGSVYQETSAKARELIRPDHDYMKIPPERLDVKGDDAPDFRIERANYQFNSSIYGSVTARVYKSKNRKLQYMMYEDADGRCWVGGVEGSGKINSSGIRSEWVDAGDLATPLYEYPTQAYGFSDRSDRRGEYECMWKDYVSKIPLIKRYMSRKENR